MGKRALVIGVDARQLELERTGVARYLINLLRELKGLAPQHRYRLYLSRDGARESWLSEPPFEPRRLGPAGPQQQTAWEHWRLPRALRRDRADVLLAPYYMAPIVCPVPAAVVLHDIAFATRPDVFRRTPLYWKLRFVAALSARRAAAVITVSDFSRREIERCYGVGADRLHVIPEAADPGFTPAAGSEASAEAERIRARYRLPPRFFLAVGSLTPRRHLTELLAAFGSIRAAHPDAALMVIGRDLEYPPGAVDRLVEASALGEALRRAEWVPESDLVALYRAATASVYLSSYEGFGLPVLESMASGTPVITSDCASLPEVAGGAALLVDPRRPAAIDTALRTVLEQPAAAESLRRRGLERAASFSWRRSAAATLEVLEAIAAERRPKAERPPRAERP